MITARPRPKTNDYGNLIPFAPGATPAPLAAHLPLELREEHEVNGSASGRLHQRVSERLAEDDTISVP